MRGWQPGPPQTSQHSRSAEPPSLCAASSSPSRPVLQRLVAAKFKQGIPKAVSEALFTLSRIVQEVGNAIQVVFATAHVVTLHEPEAQIRRSNTNFVGVRSFDELRLGPLRAHPEVARQFKAEAQAEALASAQPPQLTAEDVIQHVSEWLQKHCEEQPAGTWLDVPLVLAKLAERHNVPTAAALGVVIRSNAFLIGHLGKITNARQRAEKSADAKLASQLRSLAEGSRSVRALSHSACALRGLARSTVASSGCCQAPLQPSDRPSRLSSLGLPQ